MLGQQDDYRMMTWSLKHCLIFFVIVWHLLPRSKVFYTCCYLLTVFVTCCYVFIIVSRVATSLNTCLQPFKRVFYTCCYLFTLVDMFVVCVYKCCICVTFYSTLVVTCLKYFWHLFTRVVTLLLHFICLHLLRFVIVLQRCALLVKVSCCQFSKLVYTCCHLSDVCLHCLCFLFRSFCIGVDVWAYSTHILFLWYSSCIFYLSCHPCTQQHDLSYLVPPACMFLMSYDIHFFLWEFLFCPFTQLAHPNPRWARSAIAGEQIRNGTETSFLYVYGHFSKMKNGPRVFVFHRNNGRGRGRGRGRWKYELVTTNPLVTRMWAGPTRIRGGGKWGSMLAEEMCEIPVERWQGWLKMVRNAFGMVI